MSTCDLSEVQALLQMLLLLLIPLFLWFFLPFSLFMMAQRGAPRWGQDTTAGFASLIFTLTGAQVIHPLQECFSYHSPASPSRADWIFFPPAPFMELQHHSKTGRALHEIPQNFKLPEAGGVQQRADPGPGVLCGLIQQNKTLVWLLDRARTGSQSDSSHHQPPHPHNLFFLCIFLAFPNVFFLALHFSRKAA